MKNTRYQDTTEIRKWAIEDGEYDFLYFYVDGKELWQFGYDDFNLYCMSSDEKKRNV